MFLGCSGTTSLGGKWLFLFLFCCDGVLGPRGVSVTVFFSLPPLPLRRRGLVVDWRVVGSRVDESAEGSARRGGP